MLLGNVGEWSVFLITADGVELSVEDGFEPDLKLSGCVAAEGGEVFERVELGEVEDAIELCIAIGVRGERDLDEELDEFPEGGEEFRFGGG